ncbi:hypothetical protein ACTXT7_007416 [Hymenolepis weldensis]
MIIKYSSKINSKEYPSFVIQFALKGEERQTPTPPYTFITPSKLPIDLRIYDNQLLERSLSVINQLRQEVHDNWFEDFKNNLYIDLKLLWPELSACQKMFHYPYRKICVNSTKLLFYNLGAGKPNDEIKDIICARGLREYAKRLFEAMRDSEDLHAINPTIAEALIQEATFSLAVTESKADLCDSWLAHKVTTEARLQRDHPILWGIFHWRKQQLAKIKEAFMQVVIYPFFFGPLYMRLVQFGARTYIKTIVLSQEFKANTPNQKKGNDRSYESGEGAMPRKPKFVLKNFWTAAHPRLDGKSPMEILMGRSQLRLPQSPDYASEKGICRQQGIRNRQKDFKRSRDRSTITKALLKKERSGMSEHRFDVHKSVIKKCSELGLRQHEYFVRRDLLFLTEDEHFEVQKDKRESRIRTELIKTSVSPDNRFEFKVLCKMMRHWKVYRQDAIFPHHRERVDSILLLGRRPSEVAVEDALGPGSQCNSNLNKPEYFVRKHREFKSSTRYAFWRWHTFFIATWVLLLHTSQLFLYTIPFRSPISFTALCQKEPIQLSADVDQKTSLQDTFSQSKSIAVNISHNELGSFFNMVKSIIELTNYRPAATESEVPSLTAKATAIQSLGGKKIYGPNNGSADIARNPLKFNDGFSGTDPEARIENIFDLHSGYLYYTDEKKCQTLHSRLSQLWTSARAAANSSQRPSNLRRACIFFSASFLSLFLILLMPVLCLLLSTLSIAFGLVALPLIPLLSLVFHLFCVVLYDFYKPVSNRSTLSLSVEVKKRDNLAGNSATSPARMMTTYPNGTLPIIEAFIWHLGIRCILQFITALLCGLVLYPIVTLIGIIFGILRWCLRSLWDTMIFHLCLRPCLRIPANDNYILKRRAGPGLSPMHFYKYLKWTEKSAGEKEEGRKTVSCKVDIFGLSSKKLIAVKIIQMIFGCLLIY